MSNWCGSIYDKEVRRLFLAAMERADVVGRVMVYPCDDFPSMHLGVVNGKLCAAPDLFNDFTTHLRNASLEDN